MDASNPEKVILDLINSGKQLSASAQGNMAVAESDGQRAQVQRFGDKGGVAQVEGHKWVFFFFFCLLANLFKFELIVLKLQNSLN